ncbi:MAG: RNA polymerase sigma-70 factor [Carboxylicivirga sp.]|jgi:RNA polymerase sigma-70 factor (ECF subfamily)|nr:RNA polymerase sigma-70 factor [Carboxylicivirga sp.]
MKYTRLFINKLRKGDDASFASLYHDLFPSLVLFARKYVGEEELSKDIVQEVFIKFWNNISSITIRTSIKSYLYMAVRNHAINKLKKKTIESDSVTIEEIKELTSSEEYVMLAQDVYHQIHNTIKELPKKSKEVILMSMNDMSISDIQDELNVSINTVKTNKRKAYAVLREKLKSLIH